jgi:hypothetical protein
MSLLHVSINAADPQRVASVLARIMGGQALPFPPFPGCWIAFSADDDGTAIEVFPLTHVLTAGTEAVACEIGAADSRPSFVHLALASALGCDEVRALGAAEGWMTRVCDRGPFACVEIWVENRLLVEVLDPGMRKDYVHGMTAANWKSMFGLE